jgi:hypothetical protein
MNPYYDAQISAELREKSRKEEGKSHKNLMKFALFHGRCQGNEGNKFMKFTTKSLRSCLLLAVVG